MQDEDIMYQSKSRSKKTLLPSSAKYKELYENNEFINFNKYFIRLKAQIISKFKNQINIYVKKKLNTKN